MKELRDSQIHMIPLDQLTIVNPRDRGRRMSKQIVDNISHVGLRRPVTATPKNGAKGVSEYYWFAVRGDIGPATILLKALLSILLAK